VKNDHKAFNINFWLLVFGRMISDTGTGIQAVIMPLYIIDIGDSAATIGLFSFLSLVPALLVYPFAGVLGDRSNRNTLDWSNISAANGFDFSDIFDVAPEN